MAERLSYTLGNVGVCATACIQNAEQFKDQKTEE